MSQRRACGLAQVSRSTARYVPRAVPEDEPILVERLQQFAQRRRRRGYRLAHQELCRSGMKVNHKRVHRLWKREGLSVPPRRQRKRIRHVAPLRPVTAEAPNQVWCCDFLEDGTLDGRKLRILCVTDEFTRESLAIEAGRSFRSERVCRVLKVLMSRRGVPGALRMDNGPEFIALVLRGLCYRSGIDASHIEPGKPWQNGFAESFHSRLRDELLDGEVFWSLRQAQVKLEWWRQDYNQQRLHSSLGYQTPQEFAMQWHETGTNAARTQAGIGS